MKLGIIKEAFRKIAKIKISIPAKVGEERYESYPRILKPAAEIESYKSHTKITLSLPTAKDIIYRA